MTIKPTTMAAGGNEFTATTLTPISKIMQVWTVQDNTVYILYYIADEPKYSAYLPIIQKGLKFLDSISKVTYMLKRTEEQFDSGKLTSTSILG